MSYISLKHITTVFFMLLSLVSMAQSFTFKGRVQDALSAPIEGVAVVLYDDDKKILSYSVTNELGEYEIESQLLENYILEVTHLAYLKQKRHFTNRDIQQESFEINFMLKDNTASLEEVIIISNNKVKDTVRLDLEKFNLYEDDNLKEILKKIPNFRLSDDGTIIYKGKNINKILVNNKPSFVSQNSIALESIENKIIKGISVINNYNDDFSLDFEENEESVLNIDTKNKHQSILNGSLEGKFGYQDKYEIKGKGFLFSKNLNAFLTNNTNNIGKTTITSNELEKLFSEGQPFSPYQGETLGTLFATDENLKRDLFTSTNATLRNQTPKIKTSGLFYYIAPSRLNSIIQNTNTLENVPLINTLNYTETKLYSFLNSLSVAYKMSDKTIAKYNLNISYIDNKNKSTTENQLFENGNENGRNTTFSNNLNTIFSSFHQISIKSKLQKKLILETRATYYNEESKLLNDYVIEQNIVMQSTEQNYRFSKNVTQGSIGVKYKFSDAFIPLFSVEYSNNYEIIKDRNSNDAILVERKQNNYLFNLDIRGKNIFKYLDYEFTIGANPIKNNAVFGQTDNSIFIPVDLFLDYENKLNRYYINYSRSRKFNEIASGINTIQPFNSVWNGNRLFPLNSAISTNLSTSYNYNNLFDAEIFSLSFSYSNQKNLLRRSFIQQQDGISEFELFVADKSKDFKASSFYSKIIYALKYPTKIAASVAYNQGTYSSMIAQQKVDVITKNISPELKIETITDNFLNFSLSSKISFITDDIQNAKYDALYTSSAFSVLLRNKHWKGSVSFLYDNNNINNVMYSRKNINLGLSYTKNNMVFSVEARHLGELLSFYENKVYNSEFIIRNGITNTIINNQSLNYIIFGIKFKL